MSHFNALKKVASIPSINLESNKSKDNQIEI